MVSASIIGFLVLLLIYVSFRGKKAQAELKQLKLKSKANDKLAQYNYAVLIQMSGQLQQIVQARLEGLNRSSLLNSQQYEVMAFILTQFEFVIVQCCQNRTTVEEAIHRALVTSPFSMEQINQCIANQPSEVRVPWCRNTISGFVAACINMTSEHILRKSKQADLRQEES